MAPLSEAEAIYAAAGEPKSLWVVEGAGHTNVTRVAGQEAYRSHILGFLREHLPLEAPERPRSEGAIWFERRRPEAVGGSAEALERAALHAQSTGTSAGRRSTSLVIASRVYTGTTPLGQAWWYLTGPSLRDSDAVILLKKVLAAAPRPAVRPAASSSREPDRRRP